MLRNLTRARLNKVQFYFAIGLAVLGLIEFGRAFPALFSNVIIDYCEMTVGGAAEQLLTFGNLQNIYAPPFAAYQMPGVQYPPLFIGLVAALTVVSGLKVVLVERLLAWSLYGLAGTMVGLIVYGETGKRSAALVATALPFCFWSVIIFVHAARVDPLALFFALSAAWLYRRQKSPNLPIIALLASLAFFSKQTYLSVSVAIVLDLFFRKSQVKFGNKQIAAWLIFALAETGWLGIGFGVFGWLSAGQFFGIFEAARAGSFIFELAPGFVGYFLLDHCAFILLASVSLRLQWLQVDRFWTIYTAVAALSCVSIIKDGAVDYYFNELAYLLAIQVGILLTKLSGWLTPVLGLQCLIAVGMLVGWSPTKDFEHARNAYDTGLALVRQEKQASLVLVDSFLLETGQAAKIGDYFVYSVLLRNGKRDPQPLLSDLNNQHYNLIITETFNKWPVAVETALATRYNRTILRTDDGREIYWVYRPRP